MSTRYAAAINDQGRFANTCIGDFNFVPEFGAHIWKGKIATNAAELAEHINGALASLKEWGDPFVFLRVAEIAGAEVVDENASTPESEKGALLETIRELRETIATLQRPTGGPTLKLLEGDAAA